ncbi:MAG: type II toxin-antitoxin system VapC family toxin [Deltaproteobacteria bacterium]|nr:type II toxin-antitoxin system VapC family toxin [Deltaproteobacteria bacterium]
MSSSSVCIDASLVVRLVADPRDTRVRDLWEKWDEEKRLLCAPNLLYFEVTNALYRYQRAHMMSASSMRLALTAALSLPIQLYGEASLHSIAIDLAERFSLPAVYDAHYLALAQHLDAEFWSLDKKLIQAVRHALPWVHSVE